MQTVKLTHLEKKINQTLSEVNGVLQGCDLSENNEEVVTVEVTVKFTIDEKNSVNLNMPAETKDRLENVIRTYGCVYRNGNCSCDN